MSTEKDVKDYADGWIQERKGTDVPPFLKLAFPVIGLGCVAYLFLQIYGDVGHATRGPLVRKFIEVSQTSPALSYTVGAMALVYVIILLAFVFRSFKED